MDGYNREGLQRQQHRVADSDKRTTHIRIVHKRGGRGLVGRLSRAREIGRAAAGNGGPGSDVPAVPVRGVLELLERDEDEHRRRLEPRPGGEPALEHEHRALVAHRRADHLQRRPALRAGRGHDPALSWEMYGAGAGG